MVKIRSWVGSYGNDLKVDGTRSEVGWGKNRKAVANVVKIGRWVGLIL